MIIPIRCFTCGKPIGHLFKTYSERTISEHPKDVLDDLGLERYCCRRMFLTHVNLIDEVLDFSV
ncbi:MAG: DNA-directed RNA polymerase subunit N [Candidatus Methanofastidiosa archaeon]|nr:DNA-directed RNA polymerase subunit N [Candidatus Methanofastidiosa archaeon]